ncbi:bifunctional 3-(3-hydroxy-phenyl)propionate/3-hydroxycinnamic acid hydroxylase [Roseomonas gilardii]|uniref:Bifunctional 3-(3-hydroxy-phenyl)propionate/3-hydroxycinnamic acid hydroxylase n=1 Tax=Roseomonas gilardii TaxID=257708 RepID=A0ABU3MK03_9PROT|nr:bifunctional 3-(3-hydroxy-phenyl)propionate/3-hydroxycinnamic acid hydroxylase [Roseomonas gilardii]MDT8333349.1 bifunctional 3-(3-hydroxy-phenyl)propionate/3-hydroxycinnamic acid hydroxylase [Roseomonas gilardii]
MTKRSYDVAVIGFGPSGAVAAGLLGRAGFSTLVIDRDKEVYDLPRAIALDHEIIRLFDNMGLLAEVLPYTAPFTASEHFGALGQLIRRIDMVPPPWPMGYTPSLVFSQPPVEAILRRHASAQESVTVRLGTTLVGIEQDEDGVILQLRAESGEEESVRVGQAIACDGASSFVRRSLGIRFEDLGFDEPWLVVDLLLTAGTPNSLPKTSAQFCNPARPTTYILGPGDHRRFEIMLLPGEDPKEMQREENVWRLLTSWVTPESARLWRAASYRFHALVAAEWRRGRVFLAGDAAHQQPPFIGQGMCQGLRDVSNLVWKLMAVRDGAAPALLDSYAEERSQHVRTLTGRIKAIGRQICERDPEAARRRDEALLAGNGGRAPVVTRQDIVPPLETGFLDAIPHPAHGTLFPQPLVDGLSGPVLMDARAGTGWRLVLARDVAVPADLPGELRVLRLPPSDGVSGPCTVLSEQDHVLADWFGRHGVIAALVRPDHYVFGTAGDQLALEALVRRFAGCLHPETVAQEIA